MARAVGSTAAAPGPAGGLKIGAGTTYGRPRRGWRSPPARGLAAQEPPGASSKEFHFVAEAVLAGCAGGSTDRATIPLLTALIGLPEESRPAARGDLGGEAARGLLGSAL